MRPLIYERVREGGTEYTERDARDRRQKQRGRVSAARTRSSDFDFIFKHFRVHTPGGKRIVRSAEG